jgi:hypothetical protein
MLRSSEGPALDARAEGHVASGRGGGSRQPTNAASDGGPDPVVHGTERLQIVTVVAAAMHFRDDVVNNGRWTAACRAFEPRLHSHIG